VAAAHAIPATTTTTTAAATAAAATTATTTAAAATAAATTFCWRADARRFIPIATGVSCPQSATPFVVSVKRSVTSVYTLIPAVSCRANFSFDTFACVLHQLVGSYRFRYDIHIVCLVSSGTIISNIFSPRLSQNRLLTLLLYSDYPGPGYESQARCDDAATSMGTSCRDAGLGAPPFLGAGRPPAIATWFSCRWNAKWDSSAATCYALSASSGRGK
jgi:hypothetical protein